VDAITPICDLADTEWGDGEPAQDLARLLESGAVPRLAQLPFALLAYELRFIDERWSDRKAKNISLRWPAGELRGAIGSANDRAALRAMPVRYAELSEALALRLFPHYRGALSRGNTSFRPTQVAGRATTWHHGDKRLHVDAFPSNPMHEPRLLRVFSSVNQTGEPRYRRVGERFEIRARRFLPLVTPPRPFSAWWLHRRYHHSISSRSRVGERQRVLQLRYDRHAVLQVATRQILNIIARQSS